MKKLLFQLGWIFNYYFGYFFYKDYEKHRYHMYMFNKYGEKYCTRDELDKYLDKYDHDLG
jgi:hypothetical protein